MSEHLVGCLLLCGNFSGLVSRRGFTSLRCVTPYTCGGTSSEFGGWLLINVANFKGQAHHMSMYWRRTSL